MPRSKNAAPTGTCWRCAQAHSRARPRGADLREPGRACGLSAATLVQRFETKAGLKQAALLNAWDRLDEKTAALAARMPKTPDGAIALLVGAVRRLWRHRSLCRGPAGAARGSSRPGAAGARRRLEGRAVRRARRLLRRLAAAPPGIGLLIASQWQGSLLWWGFDPQGKLQDYVADSLAQLHGGRRHDKAARLALSDLDQHLANVVAREEAEEGGGRVLEAFDDRLAPFDLALDFSQPIIVAR